MLPVQHEQHARLDEPVQGALQKAWIRCQHLLRRHLQMLLGKQQLLRSESCICIFCWVAGCACKRLQSAGARHSMHLLTSAQKTLEACYEAQDVGISSGELDTRQGTHLFQRPSQI